MLESGIKNNVLIDTQIRCKPLINKVINKCKTANNKLKRTINIIIISGDKGAGKTFLLQHLAEKFNSLFIDFRSLELDVYDSNIKYKNLIKEKIGQINHNEIIFLDHLDSEVKIGRKIIHWIYTLYSGSHPILITSSNNLSNMDEILTERFIPSIISIESPRIIDINNIISNMEITKIKLTKKMISTNTISLNELLSNQEMEG